MVNQITKPPPQSPLPRGAWLIYFRCETAAPPWRRRVGGIDGLWNTFELFISTRSFKVPEPPNGLQGCRVERASDLSPPSGVNCGCLWSSGLEMCPLYIAFSLVTVVKLWVPFLFVCLFVGSMADGRTFSLYWVLEKHSHVLEGWCVNRARDGGWPMK